MTASNPLRLVRYKVRHHTEEAACPRCGEPSYVGDRAISVMDDLAELDAGYCSRHCARQDYPSTARKSA